MAEYVFRVGTPSGEIVLRKVEAVSPEEARQRLEREGYRVFTLAQRGRSTWTWRFSLGRVKLEDFLHFNQQLAALVRAGLPVLQAISMLARRQSHPVLRSALRDVEERIREGALLSQAFASRGDVFPRLYIAAVLAGERSGNLDEMLLRYVAYTKQMVALKRRVRAATTYPIFLLCSLIGLVAVMTGFVIPRFRLVYEDFGGELPVITQIVLAVGQGVRENLVWGLPALLALIVGLMLWRRTEGGRAALDALILKLPIVGPIVRDLAVAQLARSLATLLRGGITLVESFRVASETLTNRVLARTSGVVLRRLQEGQAVADSLAEAGWLPPLAIDIVRVGERAGSLKEMLDELANFYDAELEVKLNQVTTLIQPIMLVLMAGLVTFVLLSMYLPLFTFISTLGAR
ncbi:Type II secretion system protein F [bacterium HR08]|nr:Type II secretion system protein F [bacterium HR08]